MPSQQKSISAIIKCLCFCTDSEKALYSVIDSDIMDMIKLCPKRKTFFHTLSFEGRSEVDFTGDPTSLAGDNILSLIPLLSLIAYVI